MKAEITAVIESQLAAFRSGDFAGAYLFAAESIRAMFPAPQFEQMVRQAYPLIANSRRIDFGLCLDDGHDAVVNVTVEGAEGGQKEYQYTLTKEERGWRITGVVEAPPQGTRV